MLEVWVSLWGTLLLGPILPDVGFGKCDTGSADEEEGSLAQSPDTTLGF